MLPGLFATSGRKFARRDGLPLLHSHLHRQGPRHGITGSASATSGQSAGRLPRRRHDSAIREENAPAIDRTPRRSLAITSAGGRLLLSRIDFEMIRVPSGPSIRRRVFSVRHRSNLRHVYPQCVRAIDARSRL